MRTRLVVETLTKEAFRPFGDVIETQGAEVRVINDGYARRFHNLATIDAARDDGAPGLSLFRAVRRPLPIVIDMVERHPLGSQAFYPVQAAPWLIVVAPLGDAPSAQSLRCFRASGEQGVNYAAGVWHFPLLALEAQQDFVVVDRIGAPGNLDEFRFPSGADAVIEL